MKRLLGLALGSLLTASAARADQPPAPAMTGLRAEMVAELSSVEKKLVDLAQAMPQEKYGWRPGEGVRSVSEVYMHVVGGNYLLTSFLGIKPPMPLDPGMEKSVMDKAKVIEAMKKSFEHARNAVRNTPDSDMDKKVTFFGQESNVHKIFMLLINHAHEHMGQSIAYARMNGVVPPWSAGETPRPKAGN